MIADKPIEVPGRWRAAAGYTLLEVMIAIAIMATILVILFGTYSAAVDRAARARDPVAGLSSIMKHGCYSSGW